MRRLAAAQGGPVNLAWVLIVGLQHAAPTRPASWRGSSSGVRVRRSVIDVNDPEGASSARATRSAAASCTLSPTTASASCAATPEGRTSTPPAACWPRARAAAWRTRQAGDRPLSARVLPATDLLALADAAAMLQRGRARRLPHRDRLRARGRRPRSPRGRAHLRGEGTAVLRSADRPPGRGRPRSTGWRSPTTRAPRTWPRASGRAR